MANESKIINGTYKGLPISISSSSIKGGRKVSINSFPGKDTQSIQDFGLIPRSFSLSIIVSDKSFSDYFEYRDRLLSTVEDKSPGVLIHPLYGRIDNVKSVAYSLSESFESFGDSILSVQFEISENTGIPQQSKNTIPEIAAANDNVIKSVSDNIKNNHRISNRFIDNFKASSQKFSSIIDSVNSATSFTGVAASTLNEFSSIIGQMSADVNSIVSNPIALADSVTSIMQSANGLYSSASATFGTMQKLFSFGDNDTLIVADTAGKKERETNLGVLNSSIKSLSLSYAYKATADLTFTTTRDIDFISSILDDQYDSVLSSVKSQDIKDNITSMRSKVLEALGDARVNSNQIISIHSLPTTSRLLSFSYYGEDGFSDLINTLNDLTDISFVEGDLEIVTNED